MKNNETAKSSLPFSCFWPLAGLSQEPMSPFSPFFKTITTPLPLLLSQRQRHRSRIPASRLGHIRIRFDKFEAYANEKQDYWAMQIRLVMDL